MKGLKLKRIKKKVEMPRLCNVKFMKRLNHQMVEFSVDEMGRVIIQVNKKIYEIINEV